MVLIGKDGRGDANRIAVFEFDPETVDELLVENTPVPEKVESGRAAETCGMATNSKPKPGAAGEARYFETLCVQIISSQIRHSEIVDVTFATT